MASNLCDMDPNFLSKVEGDIQEYFSSRKTFNQNGGTFFVSDRKILCNLYLEADLLEGDVQNWLKEHEEDPDIREDILRRFEEWDQKISYRILKKINRSIKSKSFFSSLHTFIDTYRSLLKSSFYVDRTYSIEVLRDDFLLLCKHGSSLAKIKEFAEKFIKIFSISDDELLNRIRSDWIWKAEHPDVQYKNINDVLKTSFSL
jgi:hypothetical protein